jgi:DNA-binding beta-propeller fold protein YncE
MSRRNATIMILAVVVLFGAYMIYDTGFSKGEKEENNQVAGKDWPDDKWAVKSTYQSTDGELKAVAVSENGTVYTAGENFITATDSLFRKLWNINTPKGIYSLTVKGDTIIAATREELMLFDLKGNLTEEWGPFEDNAIITSVSAKGKMIVFADAGNKIVVALEENGRVKNISGLSGKEFIIPSAYFDVALADSGLYFVANTGHRRIETRDKEGNTIRMFGEAGTAPGAFCGCCNPAHFALIPGGFVTAEKGINRIKILDMGGNFVEFVSSANAFFASVPLDLAASSDGKKIYAANPVDSKLYLFERN